MGQISLESESDSYLQIPHAPHEKALADVLRAVALQTYLLLELKTDMVSEANYVPVTRSEARQCKLAPKEPIKYLGRGFAITKANGEGSEFGSKQRFHIRRGHWRLQQFNKKDSPTFKPIWIQPYYAGSLEKVALVAV